MSARDIAKELPLNPGCYLMKDKDGKIIYVGKAKSLRKRVTSYFLPGQNAKTAALVEKIVNIDYIITGNEYEALILENNLIKEHNPHYNILLKDGKSYPLIKITIKEDFPRVYKTRRHFKDGNLYFGPFASNHELNTYLEMVKETYPIRVCTSSLKERKTACLYYHINRCSGPCIGKITKEEYRKYIDEIVDFLSENDEKTISKIQKEMQVAAKNLNFEEAAKKRDLLNALKAVHTNQNVEDFSLDSRDYIAIEMRDYLCSVSIMQFRDGRLIGKAIYRAESLGDETETLLSFLTQYYMDGETLPQSIYVTHEIDAELLKQVFNNVFEKKLDVSFPKEGKHYRILAMARENALRDVEKRMGDRDNSESLEVLQKHLNLPVLPEHIEGFDIAQLAGKYTIASLIVFKNGNPSVSDYRRFNIKSLDGKIDDFESMREAVTRRYTRLINENLPLPDLIMVDGGKGQVNAAKEMLELLGLDNIPLVGLAEKREEIVFSDDRESLLLDHSDKGLRVLIALRDEAHRFATSHNQRLRSKEASFSLLESIDGIGKERSKKIMAEFVTLEKLLENSAEEISKKAKIPLEVSKRILHKLTL